MKTKDNVALKQKKYNNQIKGLITLGIVLSLLLFGHFVIATLSLLLFYVLNEVLWSDHIFYDHKVDYNYQFNENKIVPCTLKQGQLTLNDHPSNSNSDNVNNNSNTVYTALLKLPIKSTLSGSIFDPYITIQCASNNKLQSQYFERGLKGQRYINISDFYNELMSGTTITLTFHHCKAISANGEIVQFDHEDFFQKKILVLAPHADDAELSAFGLYSQSDAHIVTITAGEIEMEDYFHFYPTLNNSSSGTKKDTLIEKASILKGRLRTWDSLAIPSWGNVPASKCTQLGYFCLTLKEMSDNPEKPITSRTINTDNTSIFRKVSSQIHNHDNKATWNNLVQDLEELINNIQPDVIVTPHPELDPHPDHFYTTKAVAEALSDDSPITLLFYANHYRSTDHFAFGPAHSNVGLPPNFDSSLFSPKIISLSLNEETQVDKALSLAMMHDLKTTPSWKKRLRRNLQHILVRRNHYQYGNNAFFSKAVKQQEVFIASTVKALKDTIQQSPPSDRSDNKEAQS